MNARAERRAAPKPARASRETRLALRPSMLAQASMEPRPAFPPAERGLERSSRLATSRSAYSSNEGLS